MAISQQRRLVPMWIRPAISVPELDVPLQNTEAARSHETFSPKLDISF